MKNKVTVPYKYQDKYDLLKKGTQIVYVPVHAHGNITHRDCEEGFIADKLGIRLDYIHCRYWSKENPEFLRTTASGESTPLDCIVIKNTREQWKVENALKFIENGVPNHIPQKQTWDWISKYFRKEKE